MRTRLMVWGLAAALLAGCGADREKMSRHKNDDHLLKAQERQIEKAQAVEGMLQDTTRERYQDQ